MNIDFVTQRELLKTALDATDAYLGVEKKAIAAGKATNQMIHDFSFSMTKAHEALQALGVLDQHQEYMLSHVKVMADLSMHDDSTLSDLPFVHVPKADYGEVEESVEQESITDEELDNIANSLTWDDIVEFYDDDELADEDEPEEITETLSPQARIKKRQTFARFRGKRGVARSLKLRRTSDLNTLQKRAKLAARRALYSRFLRGRDKSKLSAAEKDRIEKQVSSLKSIQSTLAQKMLPKIRGIEQKRLAGYRAGKAKK